MMSIYSALRNTEKRSARSPILELAFSLSALYARMQASVAAPPKPMIDPPILEKGNTTNAKVPAAAVVSTCTDDGIH
jgi:hypothetical protein